jgi:hypothetical protein
MSVVPASVSANEAECTVTQINAGLCDVSGSVGEEDVTLIGGGKGGGSAGSGGASGSGGGEVDDTPANPAIERCTLPNPEQYIACDGNNGASLTRPDDVAATPPVTLADIARFRPDPGRNLMEPDGWMIVGLDTNFYSIAGSQIHDGTLLGQPASVRFTPVQWRWAYGDGASARFSRPGSTWAAQGIPEFDPTPTSHIYRSPGTYVIRLTIDFRAEYRFAGQSWIPISGILAVPANELVATVGDAKTVLVERDCVQNPGGPGC